MSERIVIKKDKNIVRDDKRLITLRIFRFNVENDILPSYENFDLNVSRSEVLLDALNTIKAEIDPSLSFRRSCRHGICGSCAVVVENQAVLACKANLFELSNRYGGVMKVNPLDKRLAVKDLIVNKKRFWDSYRAVSPWLEASIDDAPKKENIIAPPIAERLDGSDACIECGICFSVCPVASKNEAFLGPAALAKIYRFAADVRDQTINKRVSFANGEKIGVWDCVKCYKCRESCPKEVSPIDKIIKLHTIGFENDAQKDTIAVRHAKAFKTSIEKYGRLDEIANVRESLGVFGAALRVREAFAMLRRGKLPLSTPKIEKLDEVKKLIESSSRSSRDRDKEII
jgi:succinate dehydrogenase / fumarate reductase iron-sulfur subunit